MAFILKQVGHSYNIPIKKFECDDTIDISNIDKTNLTMGTEVYVINTGETYVLNSNKEWKIRTSSGGGGDIDPSNTYIYDGGGVGGY